MIHNIVVCVFASLCTDLTAHTNATRPGYSSAAHVKHRQHLPLNAAAVVFAVPCPLEGYRPDVKVTNGGILRMDETACTPRRFHILLPHDQVH